ncbi:hypothetical protein PRK78_001756 [Emydomyces testavorans]|uniref:Uncharacterized protein n=1 Tax=Emydomyces testavorans TaxID=2070801 RepID=A0AAF0DDG2_9EURO|nr:hypothetical protein PRK78_001756 [Emydomyces testavorans]
MLLSCANSRHYHGPKLDLKVFRQQQNAPFALNKFDAASSVLDANTHFVSVVSHTWTLRGLGICSIPPRLDSTKCSSTLFFHRTYPVQATLRKTVIVLKDRTPYSIASGVERLLKTAACWSFASTVEKTSDTSHFCARPAAQTRLKNTNITHSRLSG